MQQALHAAWQWVTYYPRHFEVEHGRDFLDAYPDYPVYSTIVFLWCVFYLPDYLERHKIRLPMKYLVAGWNLFLSIASTYGAYYTFWQAGKVIGLRTFHNNVCEFIPRPNGTDLVSLRANAIREERQHMLEERHIEMRWVHSTPEVHPRITSLYDGEGGFSVAMFGYLKMPELLDTLFLILQDKPVSFLHWYHHIATAIYVWITSYQPIPSGIAFCAMNYLVHSIMYFYYFLVVLGLRKTIRPFAPVITLLQVTQMFVGMYITVYSYLQYWLAPDKTDTIFYKACEAVIPHVYPAWHHFWSLVTTGALAPDVPEFIMADRFWGCDSDPTNMRMGMMMYGSYCVLFAVLFKELYLDKRAHKNSLVLLRKERERVEKAAKDAVAADGANKVSG